MKRTAAAVTPLAAPTGLRITGTTQTSITISWSYASRSSGYFEIFKNGVRAGGTTAKVYTVGGLSCGASYTLGVRRTLLGVYRSATTSIVAATSPCPDSEAPSTPTQISQIARTSDSATVSWRSSTDKSGVVGYQAYSNGVAVGTTAGTSFTFTGLVCGASYEIAITAYDANRNTSPPAYFTVFTSTCADTAAPTVPGAFGPSQVTRTKVSLRWNGSTDNTAVAGYGLWKDGRSLGNVSGTTYDATDLTCGASYAFAVDAFDTAGNRSAKSSAIVATSACASAPDTQAPSVPENQRITGSTGTTVTMAWSAASDNVGVAGYEVWLDGAKVGTTTALTYVYSGLTCGSSYTVGLVAFDAAGNSSDRAYATGPASTSQCGTTSPPPSGDAQAPSIPADLTVTSATATTLAFAWSASTDNVAVSGYAFRRGSTQVGTTTGTTYALSGLTCGQGYTVSVEAYDAAGNTSPPTTLVAATSACPDGQPPSPPTSIVQTSRTETSISIGWAASTDNVGVIGYSLLRDGASVENVVVRNYTFTGLACGTSYTLAVRAYDAAGNVSSQSAVLMTTSACLDTQPPSAPQNQRATATTGTTIALAWDPSTDNVGVVGYDVVQGVTTVGSTTATSYTVASLACGTSYTFAVVSRDAAGNTARSTLAASTAACANPPSGGGDVFVSNGGSDSNACTASAPCKTFDKAYRTARPGDHVEVAGGTYSFQTIPADPSKTSTDDVVFRPAAGATVTVNGQSNGDCALCVYGDHVELRDFRAADFDVFAGADDVTLRNLDVSLFWITSASNVRVIGGDVGPATNNSSQIRSGYQSTTPSTNIVIEGVRFHDYVRTDPDMHMECLQVWGTRGITVSGSTFRNCAIMDLFFENNGEAGDVRDVTIENNFFDAPGSVAGGMSVGSYPLLFDHKGKSFTNVLIRNNSFLGTAYVENGYGGTLTNVKMVANVGPRAAHHCYSRVVFEHNVWDNVTCGATDTKAALGFRDAAALDLHLVPGAAAIDKGSPTSYPSTDIDGQSRSGAPDAGADEAGGGGGTPPPPSPPPPSPPPPSPPPPSPPPPSGDADVYLAPNGSDANACTQAAPCKSMNRGYRVAQAGDVVEVAAGTYGDQTVQFDSSKTSTSDVVFRPAAGASVTMASAELYSGHITVEGFRFTGGWRTWDGISDFTFRNVTGQKILIYGTRDVSVIGGDYGPSVDEFSFIATTDRGAGDPTNILIDGVRFHDYSRTPGAHTECLHVAAADGITIRNSRFERCSVMDVFFTTNVNSASPPHDVVLENNVFGPTTDGYFSVLFDTDYDATGAAIPWNRVTVRNNTFGQAWTIEAGSNSVSSVRVVGNAGEIANCRAGVTHSHNVWKGRSCAASDKNVGSLGFLGPGALDYRLASTSAAIDAGDPADFPSRDIAGTSRPRGTAPDAGAYEF